MRPVMKAETTFWQLKTNKYQTKNVKNLNTPDLYFYSFYVYIYVSKLKSSLKIFLD